MKQTWPKQLLIFVARDVSTPQQTNYETLPATYLMAPLDGRALPYEHVVAEVAEDVPVVQLVHVRRHVISL